MSEEKAIRIIPFSGKKNDWRQWSRKFLAIAHRRGFKEYLDGTKTITSTSSADEIQKNTQAYNEMLLAMSDDVSFGLVDESTTTLCPDGDAKLAWTKLQSKFESQTSASRVKLMNQFTNNKLRKLSQDPDVWISELELLRTRLQKMGSNIDESYVMIHIMNNLPSAYDNLIDSLEDKLGASTDALTLESLREKLSEKYEKIKMRKRFKTEESDSDDDEKALFAGGKFKGRCHYCGKFGHKASECRKKKMDNGQETQNRGKRFTGKCNFCGKIGHREKDCWKKHGKPGEKANNEDDNANNAVESEHIEEEEEETALLGLEAKTSQEKVEKQTSDYGLMMLDVPQDPYDGLDVALGATGRKTETDEELWLGDTGASCHMTYSTQGMRNLKPMTSSVIFGNGHKLQCTHIGEKHGLVVQNDGTKARIKMKNVKVVPDLFCNLFSISAALKEGCRLEGNATELTVSIGNRKYRFDNKIKSGKGFVFGIRINSDGKSTSSVPVQTSHHIQIIHERLGHPGENITRSTAKNLGMKLHGTLKHCDGCVLGKMRQKNIPKHKIPQAKAVGQRFFLDISSIKYKSSGGAKYLALFMDDHSGFLNGVYLKRKSDLEEKGTEILHKIENDYNVKIERIRCDNAGENISFEKECARNKMKIKFEYTAAATPQQNGRIERKFATLYGRVRAMFISAGIEGRLRKLLWAEAMNTAIDLDNIMTQSDGKSAYQKFTRKMEHPRYAQKLRKFGEIGVIMNKRGHRSKMTNRGKKAMMVGYHRQSGAEVYRMYNFETEKITQTRDVRWTNEMYKQYQQKITNNDDSDDESKSDNEDRLKSDDDVYSNKKVSAETSSKVERALRKLDTFYNPTLGNFAMEDDFCFVGGTDDNYENPETFAEAYHHPDEDEREKWREAINKEFSDMIKRKVWRHTNKNKVPKDRRIIGNKWVFKRKRNGVYRARLVGLGYAQIPGVDHKDNFSPVISEVAFRCVLALALVHGWTMEIVDVVTAFLYGELDETIYMTIPEGLDRHTDQVFKEDDCVILDKSIYGLVQAARQFHKKLLHVMTKEMNFEKCKADECLLYRKNEKGTVIVCVYIDDTLCVGDTEAVDAFKKELREHFDTKEEGQMTEYVGCKVRREQTNELIMYQDDLLMKIDKHFGKKIIDIRKSEIPAGTGDRVVRSKEGLITKEAQSKYRSGVGMLLFLVKYSRPDIANAVRELSKANDGATENHMKMLLRVIKYVLLTKNKVLRFKVKDRRPVIRGFSDSDWAGDKDDRRSITGYCVYFMDCLVAWKSRAQKNVTLSSSEAEYVAVSEICSEIKFIKMIMQFLKIEIEEPIKIYCDNVGAIFMSHNAKAGARTKHIDIKYHFIREQVENGMVEIVFVRSEENDADIFTKNVGKMAFMNHSSKFMKE